MKEETEDIIVIDDSLNPSIVICNYCDSPFDTDDSYICPICGNEM